MLKLWGDVPGADALAEFLSRSKDGRRLLLEVLADTQLAYRLLELARDLWPEDVPRSRELTRRSKPARQG